MEDLRLTINKMIKNFDEEDLNLVYSLVKRLDESYEYETEVPVAPKIEQKPDFKNPAPVSEKNMKYSTNDIPHKELDFSSNELLDDYGISENEELLERLMMWKRD
ncbi:tetratricopeptide repeat domain protein [Peptoniphilus asaccharolyticus DSM 20463]|uniref:Tetratricopeptide repeat domain protein n=1 Tax=Peptoniphilus asaccharolyticus DSM 20463 TaxID=573058 RepID=A0A1W1V2L8_PEPAS|nr:hypothetical protein [Peptoniphilus asaccharolyticus]MBL7576132.1 hypothetical protein [Peptoniphilus asaccharolyticus]SMB87540.1 tetratricopeptide repeat domain protein [Peptoniphilus asaccharolyticus DSM 20463]